MTQSTCPGDLKVWEGTAGSAAWRLQSGREARDAAVVAAGEAGKGSAAQTRGQPGPPSPDTMLRRGSCQQPPPVQHHAASSRGSQPSLRNQPGRHSNVPEASLLLLFLLLASWTCACQGVPVPSQELQAEQDLQLWNEIDDACSAYLSIIDPHPETSSALEELCFMVMGFLQKPQSLEEKDNTKRFLFHYSKTHDSGNSDIMSSVLHPLLQLVPQLHERRLKRYKADDELQGPGGIQSRGYFLFRPRNGRRSAGFR
ncbi:putative C-mannosyltransferase DPY19L3 [Platysternon megacephalum]|uniref:Putative C-mannosyltransferase DPY19L3 n=1 Tax=Platysternon megacephalum TaxID=55544 RepID=A0A4D9EW92_9SAUR|nr:putative C-mannosyltransferase DPY19L3 [Platysternon megacephalum]